jgi:ABC-type nitrate/sulfonate/bicarbonate transport system substrate-binding protein
LSRSIINAALVVLLVMPVLAHAQTALRVPVVSRTVFYMPAWTAEKQGFFKEAGLDVNIEVYDGSEKIFHDLRAGTHQIASPRSKASSPSPTRAARSDRRRHRQAAAALHHRAARDQDACRPQGKDHRRGVDARGTTFFVADIAKAGGFKLEDVKVRRSAARHAARLLKERKIDMGLQPYPLSYEAEAAGFSNLGAMAKLVPDYQFVSVMVDEDWARATGRLSPAFLKALRRGTDTCSPIPTNRRARRQGTAHQPCIRARARSTTRSAWTSCRATFRYRREPAACVQHHAAGRCAGARGTVRTAQFVGRELLAEPKATHRSANPLTRTCAASSCGARVPSAAPIAVQ